MGEIFFFNSLNRRIERSVPFNDQELGIYTCGPTVYQYAHLGNLRAYLFADSLRRTLEYNGHKVRHVINITDVGHLTSDEDFGEDKVELAAKQSGESASDITAFYIEAFKNDLERLNVLSPAIFCRATNHISDMIELIRKLEVKGFTYITRDGVYFDTSKDPNYPAFGRHVDEESRAHSRIGGLEGKKHPQDFALWKLSLHPGRRQMEWDSPWGVGFPGWHIECSAMSTKYLGSQFDIHTGGQDHISVHHTNEIAQSENALGVKPWVRCWLHCEFLRFGTTKMSKSEGNVVRLGDLERSGFNPMAFRYLCLTAHYRTPMTFNETAIQGAERAWQRLVQLNRELALVKLCETKRAWDYKEAFLKAINDDLDMPQAVAVLWGVLRNPELEPPEKHWLIKDFDRVLGLGLGTPAVNLQDDIDPVIEKKIKERFAARSQGDFVTADRIRRELLDQGIILQDTREETRWRYQQAG